MNGTYATLNGVVCAASQVRHTTGSQMSDDKRYEWDIRHTVRSRLRRDTNASYHRKSVVRRQTLRMGHTPHSTESLAPPHKCVIPQEASCPTTNATNGTYATLYGVVCAATQVRHTTGSQLSDDKRYEWDIRHTVRSRLRRDTSASYHRKSVVRRQTLG